MREVIIYKWDNFQLKLKLSSVFHQSTVSVGFGGKVRRSRVSYFFLPKLGVLFVFCLFVSFLLCLQYWSNFLKKDTQEKSVLLANDGRLNYHRSKWSPSLSLSSWLFILFAQDHWTMIHLYTRPFSSFSLGKPNSLHSTRTPNT